ncbi:phage holin family protein [Patescibacteria group bacterium]|nr:phage holin family protein [Patescibacteria group bacterium]
MRNIVKQLFLSTTSFFVVGYFFPGIEFEKIEILLVASIVFAVLIMVAKPILKFISLPLNLFTFGLFSFFSGALLLYLISIVVSGFSIVNFDFSGLEISGFFVPKFHAIAIFSALIASILISWLNTLLRWVFH